MNLLDIDPKRIKQIFHNIEKWDMDWFRKVKINQTDDLEPTSDVVDSLETTPLVKFLKSTLNLIVLHKDIELNK